MNLIHHYMGSEYYSMLKEDILRGTEHYAAPRGTGRTFSHHALRCKYICTQRLGHQDTAERQLR